MDEASSTWQLMAAAGFVVVNAFFVASEYAMVKVQPARLRELASSGNRRAAVALHITERLGTTIPTTQLGITVSSIALGWIGVPALARILAAPFSFLGGGLFLVRILSGIIGFLTVSFLHTVLGELAPKAISVQRAEAVALWCAIPLNAFCQVSAPFSWLLNRSAECLLGTLGLRPPSELATVAHSEEEIRMIVSSSQEQGILEEHEVELVENILDYTDRVAREIMTPRNDVRVLFTDQSLDEAIDIILREGYARYPLCRDERDHVIGVIHMRDMFAAHLAKQEKELEEIAREPLIIPETLPLNQVQQRFQLSGTQMAVVLDEYGAFSGIVTFEDLVEEVFGEFRDEFDHVEPETVLAMEDGLELDAGMLVEEAFEVLGVEGHVEFEGVDTVGGLVFSLLGERPEVGDVVTVDGHQLKVAAVEGLRITRVKATPTLEAGKLPEAGTHPARGVVAS
ncbi:MAG: hemolysin family protein [Limnochordia bacterium]|jgi:CBS domain containing-hemolysin-like protein